MANFIETAPVAPAEYDLFIRPFLDDPRITDLPFDFINTKFVDRKAYFNTDFTGTAYEKVTCGWTYAGGVGFTEKDIIPVELALAIEQCYEPLMKTIFANGFPDGWERGKLSPEVRELMQKFLADGFNLNLLQLLFLGDDSLSTNPYQISDGIYKRLQEGALAGDGTVDANVTLNATTLNTTNFHNTMMSIYAQMPNRMKRSARSNKSRLRWIWTDLVYAAYEAFISATTQTNAGIIQREGIVGGISLNQYLGIPITVVPFVDDALLADFPTGSPATGTDPYRVILTDPSNHKVYMDNGGFTKIHTWYSDDDDKYRAAVSALFFYQYGYGDLNLFSGF